MPARSPPTPPRTFDVSKYGAAGDGKELDSPPINKAIDAAFAAGGGRVYFPAGAFLSGSMVRQVREIAGLAWRRIAPLWVWRRITGEEKTRRMGRKLPVAAIPAASLASIAG